MGTLKRVIWRKTTYSRTRVNVSDHELTVGRQQPEQMFLSFDPGALANVRIASIGADPVHVGVINELIFALVRIISKGDFDIGRTG